ncbi:hypothetical protein WOLCODRAFT_151749 [Wolfiporia cocos MD-104 SS10]|uniref:Uncharacterized protein n=1 Tax=Wolfiporia cocos (strain MD-104) TaxID=742152 RepID=A0A2H3JZV0_WOLCO|nr:hypothetical protein WOLCODRAFT_151749 [Wolfiporia cocos MD-104 SS10]
MQAWGVPAPPRAPSLQSTVQRRRRPPHQPRPWIGRPPAAPCPARLPVREDQRVGDRLCARARRLGNGASTWVASGTGPTVRLGQDAQADRQRSAGQPLHKPYRQRRLWGKTQPKGPPTRTVKTRKAPHGPKDTRVQTRTPPDPSGSDKTTPVNGRAPAEGHTARATARVEQTQPQATATSPLSVKTAPKVGKGAQSPRQPAAHQVERQRRLPKQPRHPFRRPRPHAHKAGRAVRQSRKV